MTTTGERIVDETGEERRAFSTTGKESGTLLASAAGKLREGRITSGEEAKETASKQTEVKTGLVTGKITGQVTGIIT